MRRGLYNLGLMRRAIVPFCAAAVAIGLALIVWYAVAPRATLVKAGDLAPDFSLPHWNAPDARGTLHGLRGSPVLLILFDSSWPTSGAALVELEKLHRRYLRDGLVVVGIALDPPQEAKAVEFLMANRGLTFTVLMDPSGRQIGPIYGVPPDRRPETYLIDASGRVVSVHLKPEPWARDDLRKKVAELLPVRRPASPATLDSPRPPG
jgi:peroxiredoxin